MKESKPKQTPNETPPPAPAEQVQETPVEQAPPAPAEQVQETVSPAADASGPSAAGGSMSQATIDALFGAGPPLEPAPEGGDQPAVSAVAFPVLTSAEAPQPEPVDSGATPFLSQEDIDRLLRSMAGEGQSDTDGGTKVHPALAGWLDGEVPRILAGFPAASGGTLTVTAHGRGYDGFLHGMPFPASAYRIVVDPTIGNAWLLLGRPRAVAEATLAGLAQSLLGSFWRSVAAPGLPLPNVEVDEAAGAAQFDAVAAACDWCVASAGTAQRPFHLALVVPTAWLPPEMQQSKTVSLSGAAVGLLRGVPLQLTVVLGGARRPLRDILSLRRGTIMELERMAGQPVEVFAHGVLIGRGQVTAVDDHFAVSLTEVIPPRQTLRGIFSRPA